MLVVLSPAKNLNEDSNRPKGQTSPRHLGDSAILVNKLKKLTKPKLMNLMGISQDLAALNVERYQNFEEKHDTTNSYSALFTFNGDAYRGLDATSLSEKTIDYTQNHLRILSGLYGILRPLDHMQPYRLEMGTKLPIRRKKNLYDFWGERPTQLLNEDIKATKSQYLLNLASDEYWSVIDQSRLEVPVIKVNFREWRKGQFRFLSYNAKVARGLMTRFVMEHELKDPEHLKAFDLEDYQFNPSLSDEKSFIFTRE